MALERRTAPRVEIDTAVRVETARGIKRYNTLNLSTGGMYLECSSPLPVGTEILLKFDLPGAGKVEAQGVVKHHKPMVVKDAGQTETVLRGMGIAFLRIEGAGAQELADQIKALTLKAH